jgi:protein required for attachment to host cells
MEITWVVIANASRARIFSGVGRLEWLEEVNDMVNPKVRLRNSELAHGQIDPRSASRSRHGAGAPNQPSGYEPNQLPDQHQAEIFARDVAAFLLVGLEQQRFRRLVLSASPEFLGVLREVMDSRLKSVVSMEFNKDYTQLGINELTRQVAALVARQ